MPGTWELFALTPPPHPTQKKKKKKRLHGKSTVKWKVNSGQSALHHPQLEKPPPPTLKRIKREAPSLHEVTSHWLHGNSNS